MSKTKSFIRSKLAHIAKIHLLVGLIYSGQIVVYHAGRLVTPDIILRRWLLVAGFTAITAWVWMVAKSTSAKTATERKMAWLLVVTDLIFASYNVYLQRGMSSRAVILYILALLAAATLSSSSAIYAAAVLSIASYFAASLLYFVLNFNEGYMLELYGEVGFYAAFILLVAAMIAALTKRRH